jgi:hypothetical protein
MTSKHSCGSEDERLTPPTDTPDVEVEKVEHLAKGLARVGAVINEE